MKLFAWGTNSHGQLGQEFESEIVSVPAITPLPEALQKAIHNCQISGGGNHSIICCGDGKIWGAGLNTTGQLCSIKGKSTSLFSQINGMTAENVLSVTCGWDFSLFLTTSGTLYGCGSNSFNQLGKTSRATTNEIFETINKEQEKFVQVSAGLRHAAAVTTSSVLHVWGAEKYVKQVSGFPGVAKVACGQRHIVALDTQNNLVAWGANHHGQCGQNSAISKCIEDPSTIEWNKRNGKIVDIASGWTHCLLLTDNQQVYTWGRNTYGQLGRVSSNGSFLPERITELEGIISIAAGSEHSLALDKHGQLWTWGWNEHGSCGNGNVENQIRPVNISHYFPGKIRSIGSGAGHSFAVVE